MPGREGKIRRSFPFFPTLDGALLVGSTSLGTASLLRLGDWEAETGISVDGRGWGDVGVGNREKGEVCGRSLSYNGSELLRRRRFLQGVTTNLFGLGFPRLSLGGGKRMQGRVAPVVYRVYG